MHKLMALLLALALLCSGAGFAEEATDGANAAADTAAEAPVILTPAEIALTGRPESAEPTHITVGNTTKVSGISSPACGATIPATSTCAL